METHARILEPHFEKAQCAADLRRRTIQKARLTIRIQRLMSGCTMCINTYGDIVEKESEMDIERACAVINLM